MHIRAGLLNHSVITLMNKLLAHGSLRTIALLRPTEFAEISSNDFYYEFEIANNLSSNAACKRLKNKLNNFEPKFVSIFSGLTFCVV